MKKKIVAIVVAVIAIIVVGILGCIVSKDAVQENKLREEADKISKLDITVEDIDMEIKTEGDYAIVEQTMKDYMNTYIIKFRKAIGIMQDETFLNILTIQNYESDGPDFVNSMEYINTTKKEFSDIMNELIEMTSEEKMKQAIEGKNLSEELVNLYYEVMVGNELTTDLQEAKQELEEQSKTINELFTMQENVLNFLKENKGKWEINGEEIEFSTQKLVDQYNEMINIQ